jgi:hypothetical protein
VIEKSFHAELYDGAAVADATATYGDWGSFQVERTADSIVVRVTAREGIDEATLADELGNYALGLTIEKSRRSENAGAST